MILCQSAYNWISYFFIVTCEVWWMTFAVRAIFWYLVIDNSKLMNSKKKYIDTSITKYHSVLRTERKIVEPRTTYITPQNKSVRSQGSSC